jgi:UDP-N-acetylglucosamine transferase subunit ALG13
VQDLVFVTVGNATQGFRRLLECVNMLTGQGFFNDEVVVIQRGNNPEFLASYCEQEDFLPMHRFSQMIHEANLVICHAGAGTLINVLQAGKVPVVMPRRRKYSEHVDDHQLELVKALSTEGLVVPAYEPENLPDAIAVARRRAGPAVLSMPIRMRDIVARSIEELIGQKK